MSADKYCIRHVEDTKTWVLKEWVPRFRGIGSGLRCGSYQVIKTFGTEAAAIARMREIAEPTVTYTYYDKFGHEDIGGI